jgi:hypothetical protein
MSPAAFLGTPWGHSSSRKKAHTMSRLIAVLAAGGLLISPVSLTSAFADAFADQNAALDVITRTAEELCYHIEQQGSHSSTEISGETSAAINAAIARLANLHIQGVGKYETEESKGVLQKDLATVMKSSIDCKLDVFNTLANKMLGWKPPASQGILNQIGKLMIQGQEISDDFVNTGDSDKFMSAYREWASTVADYLGQALGESYAAQFLAAQPTITTRGKVKFEYGGNWQKLEGQNAILNQILVELRRGG